MAGLECDGGNAMEEYPALATSVYLLLLVWLFFGLHLLCEHYFIHSITTIVHKLGLREDVAGATLMAVASSLPEVLANFVDVFGRSNSLGVSTVVGSCVFNVLGGLGYAMLRTHTTNANIKLDLLPIIRDTVFWLAGTIALLWIFLDERCEVVESAALVVVYFIYVLVIACFPRLRAKAGLKPPARRPSVIWREKQAMAGHNGQDEHEQNEVEMQDMTSPSQVQIYTSDGDGDDSSPVQQEASLPMPTPSDAELGKSQPSFAPEHELEAGKRWYPRLCMGVYKVASYPLKVIFMVIPDCSEAKGNPSNWPLTMFLSVGVMTATVFAVMELGNRIGCMCNIPPVIMGATVLAIGTSMPDVMSSTAAAKLGLIGMSTSNAIGSNVFNIFFALGFPWLVFHLANPGVTIPVSNHNLYGLVFWMVGTAGLFFLVMLTSKWHYTFRGGAVLLVFYVVFIVYTATV